MLHFVIEFTALESLFKPKVNKISDVHSSSGMKTMQIHLLWCNRTVMFGWDCNISHFSVNMDYDLEMFVQEHSNLIHLPLLPTSLPPSNHLQTTISISPNDRKTNNDNGIFLFFNHEAHYRSWNFSSSIVTCLAAIVCAISCPPPESRPSATNLGRYSNFSSLRFGHRWNKI